MKIALYKENTTGVFKKIEFCCEDMSMEFALAFSSIALSPKKIKTIVYKYACCPFCGEKIERH